MAKTTQKAVPEKTEALPKETLEVAGVRYALEDGGVRVEHSHGVSFHSIEKFKAQKPDIAEKLEIA